LLDSGAAWARCIRDRRGAESSARFPQPEQ
jgi:hypothetical protein